MQEDDKNTPLVKNYEKNGENRTRSKKMCEHAQKTDPGFFNVEGWAKR